MNSKPANLYKARITNMLKKAFPALIFMLLPALAAGASLPGSVSSGKSTIGITNSAANKNTPGKLPIIDGQEALASVAGDPITVEEFNRVLAQLHNSASEEKQKEEQQGKKDNGQPAQRIDYAGVLDRLINVSMADHEAMNIGLDKLPQVKKQIELYSDSVLMGMVGPKDMNQVKPDPSVERSVYRGLVKEYKIKSAIFNVKSFAEEAQKAIQTQKERDEHRRAVNLLNSWANNVKAGEDFDKVVRVALKKGFAVGSNLKGVYVKPGKMPANIAAVVGKMKVGQTSPLLRAGVNEFVLLKLVAVRYPEGDSAAMDVARQEALKAARFTRFVSYVDVLQKKYVTMHADVWRDLDKIDYTAKNFDIYKLEKDKRILADVKWGKPVTVGELAKAIDTKFYHGLSTAKNPEVLEAKGFLFREILAKRALRSEAIAEGLQNTKKYTDAVDDYSHTLLFGVFMDTVVVPQIKLKPADLVAYYKKNIADYSADEMMRIRAIVFKKSKDAEGAVLKLKHGDEFHWIKTNAQGQVSKDGNGLMDFGDKLIYVNTFPKDVQKALKGAKTGDARLYEGPKKLFYALYVEKEVPPAPKPFEEVKDEIKRKVFGEKFMDTSNQWFAKLRKAYDVRIYDDSLRVNHPDDAKKTNKTNKL